MKKFFKKLWDFLGSEGFYHWLLGFTCCFVLGFICSLFLGFTCDFFLGIALGVM